MSLSPESPNPDYSLGKRLLEQATESFAAGLKKSGDLHPGVVVRIEIINPREARKYYHETLGVSYDGDTGKITRDGRTVFLPEIQGEVFETLLREKNSLVEREKLQRDIWGHSGGPDPVKGTVDSIRRKLNKLGINSRGFVRAVHGKGYTIDDEAARVEVDRKQVESPKENEMVTHPYFAFDKTRSRLKIEEDFVYLTDLEAKILDVFCTSVNKIVLKHRLVDLLGENSLAENIRTHINHLRNKIKNNREITDPLILSIQNTGYMLVDFSQMSEYEKAAIRRNVGKSGTSLRAR